MKRHATFCCLAALLAVICQPACFPALAADAPGAAGAKGMQAITKPSKDVTVSFVRPGRVQEVVVAKGDEVKESQLIARQDDSEEQAALAIEKLVADDTNKIDAEKSVRAQKAKDAERMAASPGVGRLELENAQLEVVVADARIQVATKDREQAQLKYNQSLIAIDKLKVRAPIGGIIAEEFLKAGESAEGGNMKLVRIVQLDPLWVEVPVPVLDARKLKKDDAATVTFSDGKDRPGKVAVISPVADPASETLLVRVAMPNPEKLQAGENVFVRFGSTAANLAKP